MKEHKKHAFGDVFRRSGNRFETGAYDPERQVPVIRCSICTGEKVAGFKDKSDGHFTEVMLIRSEKDLQRFKDAYRIDHLKTEY